MDKKDNKTTGNPMLTLALLGPLGSLFGAPHPSAGRIESKPNTNGHAPRRPR